MPWSDNSEPGSKPGGKTGPWGKPSAGGGNGGGGRGPDNDETPRPRSGGPRRPSPPPSPQQPEDLVALWERLQRRIGPMLGPNNRGAALRVAAMAAGALVALWLASGFYVVQPNEKGVVTTFGAWTRTDEPGPRYHLPAPFEAVETIQIGELKALTLGDDPAQGLMLTGDGDIVDMNATVHWRINNAGQYLFGVADADETIKTAAESALREAVGRTPMAAILTTGGAAVQNQARARMQQLLDRDGAGVSVVDVEIHPNLPREAIPDAQAVAAAREAADSAVNEARIYQSRTIAEAKGDAAKAITQAEAYRDQTVLEAQGDAARFTELDQEYRRAPAITRERLYLETLERVLAKSNKVIVDAKGVSVVLPPEAFKPRPAEAAAAPPAPALIAPAAPPSGAQPQGASQ